MNFERIARMAICYWSSNDKAFIVESPIFGQAVGLGATPQEAIISFQNSLAIAKDNFEAGCLAGAQPSERTGIDVYATINSVTDVTINRLTMKFDCSVDEAIDYMALYFKHAALIESETPALS